MRCGVVVILLCTLVSASAPAQRENGPRNKLDDKAWELRQLMREIRATRDPARREELLRRHEQALRETMREVNGSTRGDLDRSMEERMQGLQDRMQTRQELLEQMIEHQAQELDSEPYTYTPQEETTVP